MHQPVARAAASVLHDHAEVDGVLRQLLRQLLAADELRASL